MGWGIKDTVSGWVVGAKDTVGMWGSSVVQGGSHCYHAGANFVQGGIHHLQQQSITELGSRVLFLGTGVATAGVGVCMLRKAHAIKDRQEKIFQATKAAFWFGASAVCFAASYLIPSSHKAQQ